MSLCITKIKPGEGEALCVHAGRKNEHGDIRPLCGGGRDGTKNTAWQETALVLPDCIRCLSILVKRAKKEGFLK